jgi:hypothetical protein
VWLLLACMHRDPEASGEARAASAASDAAWSRRAQLGLAPAGEPLLAALEEHPGAPGAAWRLVRWTHARGLAAEDPDEAKRLFGEAREAAIACLDQSPGFAAWHAAGDWARAADAAPEGRQPCAAWGALAWTRWVELQGPAAASLDFDAIEALIAAGARTPGDNGQEVARWAAGRLAALRPPWAGQDLAAARRDLEATVAANPESVVRRIDLHTLALAEAERPASAAAIRALRPRVPEEIAAQRRFVSDPTE